MVLLYFESRLYRLSFQVLIVISPCLSQRDEQRLEESVLEMVTNEVCVHLEIFNFLHIQHNSPPVVILVTLLGIWLSVCNRKV